MVKKRQPAKQEIVKSAGGIIVHKKAEDALSRIEENFRSLVATAGAGIATTDREGNLTFVNDRLCQITGYSREALIGSPFADFLHKDDSPHLMEALLKAIGGIRISELLEFRLLQKAGQCIWVHSNPEPIVIEGQITGFSAILYDITDRKQLEEALVKSEERYRTILDQMQDSYYEVDPVGNFTFISESAGHRLGYSREEMLGQNYRFAVPEEDVEPIFAAYDEVYRTGKPNKGFPHRIRHKDGSISFSEVSIDLSRNKAGEITGFKCVLRDITHRKQVESALQESEERFRNMANLLPQTVFETDEKGNFTFVNRQGFEMFGYNAGDIAAGMSVLETIIPPDRDRAVENISRHIKGEEFPSQEYTAVRQDGSKFPAAIYASPIMLNSRYAGMRGILIDITERIKAEGDLQQRAMLLDAAYDSIIAYDPEGKIIYANETACSLRGYTKEEMLAMNMRQLVPPEELPRLDERQKQLAEQGELSSEAVHVKKNGSVFLVDTHLRLVELAGHKLTIAVQRDITERKQMEKLLIDNEARYRSLFEHNPVAVYSLDRQGRFTSANAAAMRLTGYSEEEALTMSMADVVAPDYMDTMRTHFEDSLRGESQSYEAAIQTKDGKRIDVHITGTPIVIGGDIVGVYGIAEDISVRKRMEEEQQRVAKLESVGLLAGGIAHDFNNILTAILGNINLARMEAAPGSELQNSLQKAEKASLRAKDLTVQLLTFAKGGAPVKTLASISELLKDTISFALRGSNVKCQFSLPDDLWQAEIDAGQVSQVVHNLVINAQQAMPTGGSIELRAENIALSETRSLGRGLPIKAGNYIRIAVADHGSGIPAEHLARIFDPYFTTKQKGSGLGLATSFSIARNHGGHLSVESELGAGSTFYLYLPASMQTSSPKQAKKEQVKPAGQARILVMDDEEDIREVAGRMLKHIGYEDIEFATDGAEAIKLYKAAMKSGHPFSAVILDLTIPGGMGGKETVQNLLKIDPGVKAIVSSGYADESAMAEYRGYGFSGMAAKPYTFDKLRQALFELMGRRSSTDR